LTDSRYYAILMTIRSKLGLAKTNMKNRISQLLSSQAEINRQHLVLGAVLFFTSVMAIGTIQLANAGTTADTNVAQNVTAGSLAITANAQLDFNSGTIGQTTIANTGAVSAITVQDTSGSGSGWTVTGYFNTNFTKLTDSNVQMAIGTDMSWYPGSMQVANNGSSNNASVNAGTNGAFAGIASGNSKTLATSNNSHADKGAGTYDVWNLKFNYTIPTNATANDYKTNFRLTIV